MNTSPTFAKTLTLRGRISAELIPAKGWRELELKGVKSMSYRISGEAEIDGEIRHVNVHIPALNNGVICGLGAAVPLNSKDGAAAEFITALCPKNGGLDTLKVLEKDGMSVIGADGLPAYAGGQDIPEGFAAYGTHYFCPTHGGLTLQIEDAAVTQSDRAAPDGTPYFEVRGLSHTVVAAKGDRAGGEPLVKFTAARQAARKTREAVPADIVM